MCGIFCEITTDCENTHNNEFLEKCMINIKRRGPDSFNTLKENNITFAASVLWIQGPKLIQQPIVTGDGILMYNGDLFSYRQVDKDGTSDTLKFVNYIEKAEDIPLELNALHGPYAFIYYSKKENKLYFGRDKFGRRSLLIGLSTFSIIISSVAHKANNYQFIEVPTLGTFCYDLKTHRISLTPWHPLEDRAHMKLTSIKLLLNMDIAVLPYVCNISNDLNVGHKQLSIDFQAKDIFDQILNSSYWLNNLEHLNQLLNNSIKMRLEMLPPYCVNCLKLIQFNANVHCTHSKIGILFSGGIDCTILALLASKYIDLNSPIDLLNVAFKNPNNAPDRATGLQSYEELQSVEPNRQWNFCDINISDQELDDIREEHIKHIIHPLNSILDDSLGCALWFASRGAYDTCLETTGSSCRVVIAGTGADELFGGYTKYRASFKKHGWIGVQETLDTDWRNLEYRNLGRDDRIVSDHGKQLKMPYLDENVVEFIRSLAPEEKTYPCPNIPHGVGEKLLLRCLAHYLGLKKAALLPKRALQFGSRIANKKENANDVSPRL